MKSKTSGKTTFKKRKALLFILLTIMLGVFIYALFPNLVKPKLKTVRKLTLDYAKIVNCNVISEKSACYEKAIMSTLRTNGIEAAFDVLAYVYDKDTTFASNCHYFTHILGREAYKKFKNKEKFELTPNTSYCGYGFYHGFMEELLQENGDIEEARKFCYFADKSLSKYTRQPSVACFHGIGHGLVDGTEINARGDSQALLSPAMKICGTLPDDEEKKFCASGAFNSLAIAYSRSDFGLKGNKTDPFYDCRQRNEEFYQRACYEQMNTYALNLTDYNLLKSLRFAENIQSDTYAQIATHSIAGAASQYIKTENDLDTAAKTCQNIQKRLAMDCVDGVVAGLIEFGKPGTEFELSIAFCNNARLTVENKNTCFQHLSASIHWLYSKEKYKQICMLFPTQYQQLCLK